MRRRDRSTPSPRWVQDTSGTIINTERLAWIGVVGLQVVGSWSTVASFDENRFVELALCRSPQEAVDLRDRIAGLVGATPIT